MLRVLDDYIDYLRHERQLSESTIAAYVSDLRQLAEFMGHRPVQDVTRDDLRAFMRELSRQGRATGTIRRHMHGFSTFWDWLRLSHLVSENEAALIVLPKLKRKVPDWLTQDQFRGHVRACGLEDRPITPHTLRHTFATQLIRQGVDLSTVSRLLGHKDIKTTTIYIHHDPAMLREAVEKLPI